jgi:arsenate reductase (thioredoxin)
MAEAFARAYGSDVMVPASAGLAPASRVASDTLDAMNEKGIDLKDHFPKAMRHLGRVEFDLIVNISGEKLPEPGKAKVIEWKVDDPIGLKYEEHCDVRDEIERKVMQLILELRREQSEPELRGFGSGRLPL